GEVTGWAVDTSGVERPVLWRSGAITALPTNPGRALALSINGWIGGETATQDFLLTGDGPVYFGPAPPGFSKMSMNRFGYLVGPSGLSAILYRRGQLTTLPLQAGLTSGFPLGINDAGLIAGIVYSDT